MRVLLVGVLLSLAVVCGWLIAPSEQFSWKRCTAGNYTGTLLGAPYNIRIPKNWNKILLVYARGYLYERPTQAEAFFGGAAYEEALLADGYALAGSALRAGGWAVKEGTADLLALTGFLRLKGCCPAKTIIFGSSMGSVIALSSIERFRFIYDGAIAVCAIGTGATRMFDASLRLNLAYTSAFQSIPGWKPSWGEVNDVNKSINFETDVLPVVGPLLANPAYAGNWEFIRFITRLPFQGFYNGDTWNILVDLFFSTQALAELETRAGGRATQNLGAVYTLTDNEKADLLSLGFNPLPALDYMNARNNYTAEFFPRKYLKLFADYTGRVRGPVITMHNKLDGLVPVEAENAYNQTVQSAGKGDMLYQTFVNAPGHCVFSIDQVRATVNAMATWLKTRTRPTAANFPSSLGFDPNYTPRPWPY